jgi:hypothetical protein
MALTYKIKDFTTIGSDVSVGFQITDDSDNQILFINKTVTKGDKTDNAIIEEAQAASQTEIDEWTGSKANVGKTWDPTSKTLS